MSRAETSPTHKGRWLAVPLAASLMFSAACSSERQPKQSDAKAKVSAPIDEEQLIFDALGELRKEVDGGKPVRLSVGKDTCVYWDTSVGYTVIRNLATFTFKKAGYQIIMIPFVQSSADSKPVVMNGPSTSLLKTGEPAITSFPIPEDQLSGTGIFEVATSTLKLEQASEPDVFPPAWLQAEDGSKIAETQIVTKDALSNTFSDTCHFAQPFLAT